MKLEKEPGEGDSNEEGRGGGQRARQYIRHESRKGAARPRGTQSGVRGWRQSTNKKILY